MNLSSLQALLQCQRRQDTWKALSHHAFTAAGRTHQQDVMPASCSNFQGPLYTFLSLHFTKVGSIIILVAVELLASIHNSLLQRSTTIKKLHHLSNVMDPINVQFVYHCRFTRIIHRQNQTLKTLFPSFYGNGKSTADRPQTSIQAQFAQ